MTRGREQTHVLKTTDSLSGCCKRRLTRKGHPLGCNSIFNKNGLKVFVAER